MTNAYLVAAFAVVWIFVFAYVAALARRAGELQRRLEALENRRGDTQAD